jgi:hypothetical protein
MRGNLSDVLPELLAKYKAGVIDALDFANFLAKYGLGTKDEVNLSEDPRVKATIRRVSEIVLDIAGPKIHALVSAQLTKEGL